MENRREKIRTNTYKKASSDVENRHLSEGNYQINFRKFPNTKRHFQTERAQNTWQNGQWALDQNRPRHVIVKFQDTGDNPTNIWRKITAKLKI